MTLITKGQKINDRYEIIKSIGEGGMANVYLAKDIILDRKVAIKVLRGDLANDEKFIRRFQREALSASSLSHPNIVEMYDVGEDHGNHYIVMEYVEGKTLKQLLKKRGHLTVGEAVDIMLQLSDGIAHAHESYIIHRDLKPQNIMIQENGQIKITDFGIAMAMNSTQLTQTNSVMGSVHYLPPEQASGKGSTIKCDIYSMGILFYELLTGILPFKGDNAVEIALKHMKEPIPSIRKQNPAIPQSIENIILKATAKNPKNRYNDVKEMYRDLSVALDEDVKNQEKIRYKYPEMEFDETKDMIPTMKPKKRETKEEEEIVKEIPKETKKKKKLSKNAKIIITLSVILALLVIGLGVYAVSTLFKEEEEIKIQDVSGMSVDDAIEVLRNQGLEVNPETEKIASSEYEAGKVVRTDPMANRYVKKGRTITIWESIGEETFDLEDYVGKNYLEIKGNLEGAYKVTVNIVKKEVDDLDGIDEYTILEQSPKAGTEIREGDTITFYVPDLYEKYPDFVNDGWTVEQVEEFCEKYNLNLLKTEEDTTNYKDGAIIYQRPVAGSKIESNTTVRITIARTPPVNDTENPEVLPNSDGNTSGDNNNQTP